LRQTDPMAGRRRPWSAMSTTASCCTAGSRAMRRNAPTFAVIREFRLPSAATLRVRWTSRGYRSPGRQPSFWTKARPITCFRCGKCYPEYVALPPLILRQGPEQRLASNPSSGVVLLPIAPEIISVLDYSRGFGHSDLVTFSERDLDVHLQSMSHHWQGNENASATSSSHLP
jgi:hypothetical protein